MNENGHPTVEDLDARERVRAQLPAISAILAIIAICLLAYGWWQQDQRDADRRAFERASRAQAVRLAATQRTAELARVRADEARHLSDARFAYSFNKLACTLRKISVQQIKRLEASKVKGYKQGEVFWKNLRDSNVPIPDKPSTCAGLPKHPPPDTAPPK